MAQKTENKSHRKGSLPKEEHGCYSLEAPWVEDVYFQREAQVNFWTVLGGLSMAPPLTQLSPLLQELQASRWYFPLYFLASVMTITNSWVQISWGSFVLKWPISIISTLSIMFAMLFQSIQCLQVTKPPDGQQQLLGPSLSP